MGNKCDELNSRNEYRSVAEMYERQKRASRASETWFKDPRVTTKLVKLREVEAYARVPRQCYAIGCWALRTESLPLLARMLPFKQGTETVAGKWKVNIRFFKLERFFCRYYFKYSFVGLKRIVNTYKLNYFIHLFIEINIS